MTTSLKMITWLKTQTVKTNTKGYVIGLSGGIDSAVVSAVCLKAVGKENCLALILPCHSQKQDILDAYFVAKHLKLRHTMIDLSPVYDMFQTLLPQGNPLAQANIKPRLRMMTLYYFANTLGYLVAGTGNKSELSVGYFTKYGDGGVDVLPLGNLYKKDVVALAQELGIPERIITKPPSAGLWQGQTDESEMGITYARLDALLSGMHTKKKVTGPDAAKVKEMMKKTTHKLNVPPIFKI